MFTEDHSEKPWRKRSSSSVLMASSPSRPRSSAIPCELLAMLETCGHESAIGITCSSSFLLAYTGLVSTALVASSSLRVPDHTS